MSGAAAEPSGGGGIRFKRDIGLGEVVMLCIAAAGAAGFLLNGAGDTKRLAESLDRIATESAREIGQLRDALKEQAGAVRAELASQMTRIEGTVGGVQRAVGDLPDINARMAALEREIERARLRDDGQDGRLDSLREASIGLRAKLEGLERASGANLPHSPGVRAR